MKSVFFGTPKFAEIVLRKLIKQDGFEIVAVVCAPDKLVGRKKVLTSPPVKLLAKKNNIFVLQPEKLNAKFVNELEEFEADVFVTCAYGKIIPKEILDLPKFGALNIHPSLLPKYRGPSPIQSALLNGDKETGVTIMEMDEEMDHGKIIFNDQFSISNSDNYTTLSKKLADLSAKLIIDVLPKYIAGEIKAVEQNHSKATYCKIIKKSDGEIDWNKSAQEIYNMWRAFEKWPGIYTESTKKIKTQKALGKIKFIKIKLASDEKLNWGDKKSGEFFVQDKKLFVMCGDKNVLEILKIQPEGKNVMDAKGFVNGYLR
jgi:methionyl-tRNA formyltransferase